MNQIPRPEYPRPQFARPDWLNLNGVWEFELDQGDSGADRGLVEREYTRRITVPFAPESEASGIGETDFLNAVWYRRTVSVPAAWEGRDVLLHFGAVDHDATVWVNGEEAGRHRGGFTSFTVDLAGRVRAGEEFTLVVRARDTRDAPQARGKQSTEYKNRECWYTRTTGIWQTVWLEPVPAARVESLHTVPQVADSSFTVVAELSPRCRGLVLEAVLADAAGEVARARVAVADQAPSVRLQVPEDRVRLWEVGSPHLYDLTVKLADAVRTVDEVASYAGLRSVAVDGRRILINGEPVFQRLVLDQGYWPETLMTAPTDEALVRDIELAQAAGFNGARVHQRVAEERFLYHADRLGYLLWGEFADWGALAPGPCDDWQRPTASFITQWTEVLRRDRNHPSIVGWCPLNETYQALQEQITQLDDVTLGMYLATKAADPSRPVLDASGYSHRVPGADVYDSHSYEQDPEAFRAQQAPLAEGRPFANVHSGRAISVPYRGQPYFVSEYGGIWWNAALAEAGAAAGEESWGYGERVKLTEEWLERYADLTQVLLQDPLMFGYCYTQLTDTFQEENGIYDFHRRPKLDIARIKAIQSQPAAYEAPPAND
jgi:beta-galactosidase/beta-glucuronidase